MANWVRKAYWISTPSPSTSRREVEEAQLQQLRRLVVHAYRNVPYYRRHFDDHGFKPEDLRRLEDLSAIPVTERKHFQSLATEEVVARGVRPERLIVQTTSGSSGTPLLVRRTWFEERSLGALRRRTLYYFGLRPRDRHVAIVYPPAAPSHDFQLPLRILQSAGLYRKTWLSCLQSSEELARLLSGLRPDVLSGYAGVMSRLSQFVCALEPKAIAPRFVAVGGEVLTPSMRRRIETVFGAPVYDTYGSHEFNLLAWECKGTGVMHTCDDGMILEVLKEGQPVGVGERGEVVGTNLLSFAMPFIRYKLGDVVTKGAAGCACGLPFSTIQTIQGRMIDYFMLPGGRLIHPYELVKSSQNSTAWIREYQLVQEHHSRIVLRAVPFYPPRPDDILALRGNMRAVLGDEVEFQVDLVPELYPGPGGKFRVYRSMIRSEYDDVNWDAL
jgi:phenylacetate-CoA ligase